ncbi:hypothetical protein NK6_4189 [Bradyrhizobium diazoefficiens]|uniref:Uncharacterized protein n=1 Tax=Bradyrhizobium diazoefficiens TaxID=1355477 RepID=A0A0E4BPF8_9BRAD|nr:hypothetical protein NK6_4189 [Bradyrhizobium diazoefficiens]
MRARKARVVAIAARGVLDATQRVGLGMGVLLGASAALLFCRRG